MVPIALDPANTRIAVVGNGELAARRLALLRKGGGDVALFSDMPTPLTAEAAGDALRRRLPEDDDLAALHALWVVDLPEPAAASLAARARARRVLVNVEDRPALCDFHSVAELRRGDLLLTISTGGAAPGLAGGIRRRLEDCFAPDWAERMEEVAALRAAWRRDGLTMPQIAERIRALLEARCWLNCPKPN